MAVAGLTSASLAGCEWGPPDQVSAPAAKQDSDDTLAANSALRILDTIRSLEGAQSQFPALAATLTPFLALHRTHLAALDPANKVTSEVLGNPSSASAAAALTGARSAELGLQRYLTAHAQSATSGQLARTLASMAAAVAQHLAVAPVQPVTAGANG